MYSFLADAILVLHFAFVVFVVASLPVIVLGHFLGWAWVRNRNFRLFHLAAIALVAAQAWAGLVCPLTTLEMWLRTRSGAAPYAGSFVQYWVQRLLYYDAPIWVFAGLYTGFGALVALTWIKVPPRARDSGRQRER